LSWAGEACIAATEQHLLAAGAEKSGQLELAFTPFNELLSLGYRETDRISVSRSLSLAVGGTD
jgi:hypothetical protein